VHDELRGSKYVVRTVEREALVVQLGVLRRIDCDSPPVGELASILPLPLEQQEELESNEHSLRGEPAPILVVQVSSERKLHQDRGLAEEQEGC
jgi:hypothetical protein